MKKLFFVLLLLSTSLFAQNFDKNWAKVIAFENEGKIKSANEIVERIYRKASSKKDEVQLIRCFFYKSKYLQVVDEDAQTKIIQNLKYETGRASVPSKSILNLIYGECLTAYYTKNRYKIHSRTNLVSDNEDFKTWTTADFEHKTDSAYFHTLEHEKALKATPLTQYEPIFDYTTVAQFKDQSLYSYLLQKNIEFHTRKIKLWNIKTIEFRNSEEVLFGDSAAFLKFKLDSVTDENVKTTLSLYQKQEQITPSLENQFKRSQFVHTYLIQNDDAFLRSLNQLQKRGPSKTLLQEIQLEKASIYTKKASKGFYSDYNNKALSVLDSILSIDNRSNAYKLAIQKKHLIKSKELTIQLLKQSYNEEYTRAFLQYKNVNNVNVTFYKINNKQYNQFRTSSFSKDSLVASIVKLNQNSISKNYPLINKNDYFEYSTDILLPQLKTGTYLVYFESDSDSSTKKASAYETITVSDIAVLASQDATTETFQVLNRKSGKPIQNATISLKHYNLITDRNGVATYTKNKEYRQYSQEPITFATVDDTLTVTKNYIAYHDRYNISSTTTTKNTSKVKFYLDRAIYRPGQTVYYKGIAIKKDKDKTTVVDNTSFKIVIKDAHYSTFKEFEVTTNEFGSFSGEFSLPKNGLTGDFRINAEEPDDYQKDSVYNKEEDKHPFWDGTTFENSSLSFKVEEYKRPKFEVTFDPKKETFRINEKIKVKGNAKAFAGSLISDAKVSYTITRFTSFFRSYYENQDSEVLVTDETKTDASGKFEIEFNATTNSNSNKEQLPVFNYRINATVTDINGETHTAETIVKVGYHDLVLGINIPRKIETKNKNEITLTSTNLNGEFLAAKGELKIYFVTPFSDKFKNRLFPKPEVEGISEHDFQRLFPYEQVQKEDNNSKAEVLLFTKKIDTYKDKKVLLDFISNYKSGNYKVVFTAYDSYNTKIEATNNFEVIQSKDRFKSNTLFTAKQINDDPKKDGFVIIKFTSVVPELYITATGNYENKVYFGDTYPLKNNETTIKIPLKKEFEEKLKVSFQSIFENQPFSDELEILLKKETPTLAFTVESFRNKIQPGSTENWSFQLKATNTKDEAEVLASMYDRSLDQFTKKEWPELAISNYKYNSGHYKSSIGFDKTYTSLQNLNTSVNPIQLSQEGTELMWFGFNFNDSYTAAQRREYHNQLNKKIEKPANAKMISGIVSDDEGQAVPGVSILVKGTQRGTTTDFDGFYKIEVAPNEELAFSMIGYDVKTTKIASNTTINITLNEGNNSLQEVVVMGYGTQKKSSQTGVAVVLSEENVVYNTAGISTDALAGQTAGIRIRGMSSIDGAALYIVDGKVTSEEILKSINPQDILSMDVLKDVKDTALYGSKGAKGVIIITTKKALEGLSQVKARTNLSETAFFLPNLKTDEHGKVSFQFTSPEALTAWKLRLLAHNKEAVSGYLEKNVVTQKELMILPNFPRFFREKDTIVINAKISNMTNEVKTGIALLQLFDATTLEPIDSKMLNSKNVKNFSVSAYGNTSAQWTIAIPEGLQGVQYKILAKAGNYSDGEENILPVLTNNMLVTESIPVWVRQNSTKEYSFANLKNNTSSTLRNHQFTFEYTSNPTWIAIQSLPYLMEYEHECAEQTFARFYANALATQIISNNPKIASVFNEWRKSGKSTSKLEENEELKSIILAETPWVKDAQNEEDKKRNLALLFDLDKMKASQEATFTKLKQKQKSSGGFSWFDGSDENEYITRHILAGLGHLSILDKDEKITTQIDEIARKGIPYLDQKFLNYHKNRTKNAKATNPLIWKNPYSDLHYLYTRSFYVAHYPLSDTLRKLTQTYLEIAKKEWLDYSLYEKGLAALTLNRFGEKETAKLIVESLKETASNNEDWGMYWIANKSGWYWYQAPIETQALLIEAFDEINQDTKSVDAMKVWLLKNRQAKNWPTTKSTTEAIYALLMHGNDWLSVKDNTVIKIGDEKILTKKVAENEKSAETGYLKINWKANEIKKEMASISIQNKSKVPGYGGIYWQYFEDLDKIKNNSGAILLVSKELYLKKSSVKGEVLKRITTLEPLKTGDLVTVRLIITTKENMEFVHVKDMRASCFEPVNVLSAHQYKDGLGYYMSTKDAATHLFFDSINKGTYVIEYDIRVNNSGEFSNGITTIESMYAPEYSSHTKGIRLKVN